MYKEEKIEKILLACARIKADLYEMRRLEIDRIIKMCIDSLSQSINEIHSTAIGLREKQEDSE